MKAIKIIFALIVTSIMLTACWSSDKEKNSMESSASSKKSIESMSTNDTSNSVTSLMGIFKGENDHMVSGNVTIKEGKLLLTNFKTDKGPDLHLYVAKGTNIDKAKQIDKIDLTKKQQTFDLSKVDPKDYDTVLIYCNKAHELFGSADYSTEIVDKTSLVGEFEGLNEKIVEGTVKIEGNSIRLSNFKTDKGPDLHVYLINGDEIDNAVNIGNLDLDSKEQIFTIPTDISIKDFKKVAIYCNKAHVFFGEAVLS